MSPTTLALIIVSVSLSATAQICFKLGLTSLDPAQVKDATPVARLALALFTPGVLGGLALYGVGTLLWLTALDRVELSQAYPFVGLGFALTALAGWWLFDDTLSIARIGGILLIVAGISLLAAS